MPPHDKPISIKTGGLFSKKLNVLMRITGNDLETRIDFVGEDGNNFAALQYKCSNTIVQITSITSMNVPLAKYVTKYLTKEAKHHRASQITCELCVQTSTDPRIDLLKQMGFTANDAAKNPNYCQYSFSKKV